MREIPARVLYTGDVSKALMYRGIGNHRLNILENQMLINGLDQDNLKPIVLPGGVIISCNNCFGTYTLRIHVPPQGDEEEDIEEYRDCDCWPCFSQGFIVAQHEIVNVTSFGSYSYSVGICTDIPGGLDKYLLLEQLCFPLDCAQYKIGEPVMISAAPNLGEYQMCSFPLMDADWYIMVQLNANSIKDPALKWWRNSDGGLYFTPQITITGWSIDG